ncbi:MAG: hypothetical protein GVY28_06420 [Alphaproteobacteria bacterium]|jgi:phage/plasmid primase-like uncharacterized protein|nr:hypothetical protein [Alphaproteobacteria bacterium]
MARFARTALLSALLAATAPATAAATEESCATRESILAYLAKEYAEQPVAMGLANSGGMIEVLTNSAGTSWTILLTKPDGETCMVAAGEGWETLPMAEVATGPEA